ncbi:PASTA domain-containing protein [Umezawaea sp. Da 62-37]|uniref:PASTA domain-containing protein n=1 Tax=Umezawaea sp. Da 62-37 TaxID=3075927 RepID=UPI0028F6E96A|nr:PASTA domain-containing protein [Umezawaea sp. Da 62-37]WNV84426.1 PASTA domain-containing protein [Umezawaea sp. Da 62-37]
MGENPPFTPTAMKALPSVVSTPAPVRGTEVAKTCTVPDVVGMVHQDAQDAMQASGLYVLLERDATGQGRLLINDRNWTTTGQMPGPGEVVDCGATVTLSAKKTGE